MKACEDCNGSGYLDGNIQHPHPDCSRCRGTGKVMSGPIESYEVMEGAWVQVRFGDHKKLSEFLGWMIDTRNFAYHTSGGLGRWCGFVPAASVDAIREWIENNGGNDE